MSAPAVFVTTPATPDEPRALTPAGQLTSVELPTLLAHVGLTVVRYFVNAYVEPDPSERDTGVIFRSGKLHFGLSALSFGSFQFEISPRKMPASVAGVKRTTQLPIPGRLYGTEIAESAHGIWTQPPHFVVWSGDIGASEAPKSTVRAVIAAIPAPEPVGE